MGLLYSCSCSLNFHLFLQLQKGVGLEKKKNTVRSILAVFSFPDYHCQVETAQFLLPRTQV